MKASTSYLLGAITFLLISAYMVLSPAWAWHDAVAIALTFAGGVVYTICGIREKLKERAEVSGSVTR